MKFSPNPQKSPDEAGGAESGKGYGCSSRNWHSDKTAIRFFVGVRNDPRLKVNLPRHPQTSSTGHFFAPAHVMYQPRHGRFVAWPCFRRRTMASELLGLFLAHIID